MRGYRIRKFTRQQWVAFGLAVADLGLLLYLFIYAISPYEAFYLPVKLLFKW